MLDRKDIGFTGSRVSHLKGSRTALMSAAVAGMTGLLAANHSAHGVISFISSNGDITSSSNWAGGNLPGINDIAEINNAGIGTISNGESFTANEIDIANPGGSGYGVLQQSGGTINIGAWYVVGRDNPGEYDFSGGTLNKTGGGMFIVLGNASQSGVMRMSGNSVVNAANSGNFAVGDNDFGFGGSNGQLFVQDQASLNTGGAQFWVGEGGGASGQLNMSGGTITTSSWVSFGRNGGTGEFDLSGGTFNKTGNNSSHFIIGDSGGGTGTVNQTGGLINSAGNDIWLGATATGTYNISGGSMITAVLSMGTFGGNGTLNLNGGLVSATSVQQISGTAVINFNGGILQALASNTSFIQGFNAANVTIQSGGAIFDTGGFDNTITLPLHGTGGLTLQGSVGSITLSGSNTYLGNTTVNGGTLIIGSTGTLGSGTIVTLNGGALGIPADSTLAGKTLTFAGGALQFQNYNSSSLSFNNVSNLNLGAATGTASSFAGLISGSGSLTYSGPGTLNLTNPANSYSGGTFINAGVLQATTGGLGTGAITVSNTGLLGLSSDSAIPGSLIFNGGGISFTNYSSSLNFNPGLNLTLGAAPGAASTLKGVLSDGPSSPTSVTYVGPGTLNLTGSNTYSGGTTVSAGTLNFIPGSLGTGSLLLNGGTIQFASGNTADLTTSPYNLLIGSAGGTVDTNANNVTFAGTISTAATTSVFSKAGLGTLTLTGSFSPSGLYVRQGTLALAGGATLPVQGTTSIGWMPGDVGTLTTEDTSTLTAYGDFNVGDNGSNASAGSVGVLNIQGNSTVIVRTLYVGKYINASGTLNQTGGSLLEANNGANPGDWRIGGAGSSADAGAVGVYNLSGGILNEPVNFQVGAYGTGTMTQTGGTATIGGYLSIGRFAGGNGLYDMSSGSGSLSATGQTQSVVGEAGTGVLKVGGSSVFTTNALYIGQDDGSTGTVQQTGGTLNAPAGVVFGGAASGNAAAPIIGTYNLAGGVLVTNGFSQNAAANVTGTVNLNGGIIQANQSTASLFGSVSHVFIQTGGANINTSSYAVTISHALQHDPTAGAPATDGGLTKTGAGSLTLSGSNTYTGPTTVSAGTLIVTADSAFPAGTSAVIAPGAMFVLPDPAAASAATIINVNGNMIVHNGLIGTLSTAAKSGYNSGGWNGISGIVSSAAAADSTHLTAVGIIQNSVDGTVSGSVLYSSFEGQSASNTDVLAKFTYYGDTNLDGKVDGSDYARIDSGFLTHASGWFNGDFNYDGVINGSDYTLIDNAFNRQGVQISEQVASAATQLAGSGATSAVPEPASLGLLGMGAAGLLSRRRRK